MLLEESQGPVRRPVPQLHASRGTSWNCNISWIRGQPRDLDHTWCTASKRTERKNYWDHPDRTSVHLLHTHKMQEKPWAPQTKRRKVSQSVYDSILLCQGTKIDYRVGSWCVRTCIEWWDARQGCKSDTETMPDQGAYKPICCWMGSQLYSEKRSSIPRQCLVGARADSAGAVETELTKMAGCNHVPVETTCSRQRQGARGWQIWDEDGNRSTGSGGHWPWKAANTFRIQAWVFKTSLSWGTSVRQISDATRLADEWS